MEIDLVPVSPSCGPVALRQLARDLAPVFGAAVRCLPPAFDADLCHDASRGQYHAGEMLARLLDLPGTGPILGVTSVDLFAPVLTFVFGEAQLEGRAAVVSTYRLRPEVYGLAADPPLLQQRLLKEAAHELGHTFGLIHCADADCVMHASTYVEEIDLKPPDFCPHCADLSGLRELRELRGQTVNCRFGKRQFTV